LRFRLRLGRRRRRWWCRRHRVHPPLPGPTHLHVSERGHAHASFLRREPRRAPPRGGEATAPRVRVPYILHHLSTSARRQR
jgi:hypothetical protein